MLRFLTAPAAYLILCGAAAAQDMPGLATLGPPDLVQPSERVPEPKVDTDHPQGDPSVLRVLGTGEQPSGGLAPRGAESGAGQAVANLKTAPSPARPWCVQERRIGTGAGFCMIN
ncbi:hypothetical protein MKK75_31680 [Methylobacterium sp. J-030]|uniref:hypothetical protein n=1 Tax=Methylobacterium sp. J-030 TaxID=2836627 RepID=UPI001FB92A12|nr:hypothetical protein [Methylobacterium sp. J-030]MCJ2073296.1 hypothetical protein [Methylobacterium sp. J-030]